MNTNKPVSSHGKRGPDSVRLMQQINVQLMFLIQLKILIRLKQRADRASSLWLILELINAQCQQTLDKHWWTKIYSSFFLTAATFYNVAIHCTD